MNHRDYTRDDRLVVMYLQGDNTTRENIEQIIALIPTPMWKLAVAWLFTLCLWALWVVMNITVRHHIRIGDVKFSVWIGAVDIFLVYGVTLVCLVIFSVYQFRKPNIYHAIGAYKRRHPDSELIRQHDSTPIVHAAGGPRRPKVY